MMTEMHSELELARPLISVLENAQEQAEAIINDFRDIFYILDNRGTILKANTYGASIYVSNVEDVRGQNISKIFNSLSWDKFFSYMQRAISFSKDSIYADIGSEVEFELPIELQNLSKRTIYWTLRVLSGHEAPFTQLFTLVGRDISMSVMLEENNQKLEFQNGRIQAILDSALQGFLTFDRELKVERDYSKRAEELLGSNLVGKDIGELLKLNRGPFVEFVEVVFQGQNWDLLKNFSKMETEVDEKNLKIELIPIYEDGKVRRIMTALTDVTEVTQLQKRAEEAARLNRSMVKIMQSKALFAGMLRSIERADARILDQADAKRLVHTWKGEFGFFGCDDFADFCHQWESKWAADFGEAQIQEFLTELRAKVEGFLDQHDDILKIRDSKPDETTIRLSQFTEMVKMAVGAGASPEVLGSMERVIEKPIEESLMWLNEVWLSAGERLGKRVRAIEWKKSALIFADVYKPLLETLVHAARNSADHGIEYPQERVAAGKSKYGNLRAELELIDGFYHLKLRDDGRGMNREKIAELAKKKGIEMPEGSDISDLLFEEDFSTREVVSEYSGRGIGLGAIRAQARRFGGDAKISAIPEGGTELYVRFKKKPLSETFGSSEH